MSKNHPFQSSNIEAIRERAVEVLMEHFSRDVMNLEEFEGLLDAVNRCSTSGELRELLSKLPPLASSKPATDMMPAPGGAPVVVDADRVRPRGFLISILGATNRAGRWIPAPKELRTRCLGRSLARLSRGFTRIGHNGCEPAGGSGRHRDHRPARDGGGGRRYGRARRFRVSHRHAAPE